MALYQPPKLPTPASQPSLMGPVSAKRTLQSVSGYNTSQAAPAYQDLNQRKPQGTTAPVKPLVASSTTTPFVVKPAYAGATYGAGPDGRDAPVTYASAPAYPGATYGVGPDGLDAPVAPAAQPVRASKVFQDAMQQGLDNSPYTPGTAAYQARVDAAAAEYQRQAAGQQSRLNQTLAQEGLTGSGAGLALQNNLTAGLTAGQLQQQTDMAANDPIRQISYLQGLEGLATSDQQRNFAADLFGPQLAQAQEQVRATRSANDFADATFTPKVQAATAQGQLAADQASTYQQEIPSIIQQAKAQGHMSDVQAQQLQDAYDNRNWTVFYNLLGSLLKAGAVVGGAILGGPAGGVAGGTVGGALVDSIFAPNSAYGAG